MAANTTQRIYELQVKLAASSLAQLKKLQSEASKTNQKLDSINSTAANVAKGLLAGFTLDRFISGISSAINYVDDLATSAEQLGGIGVESFSALTFAAEQSDVSIGGLKTGLKELQKSINEMATGSGKGGAIMKALGIETAGKSIEEVLGQFADGFKKIKDPVTQTNALLEVFGRSGLELRPLLNKGSEGIAELTDKARELGLVVDQETADKLGRLDNVMEQLRAQTTKLFVDIADGLAPSLLDLSKNFADAQKKGEGFKNFGKVVGVVLEKVTGAALVVATAFEDVGSALGALAAMSGQIASGEFRQAWDIIGQSQEASKQRWSDLATRLSDLSDHTDVNAEATIANADAQDAHADATSRVAAALANTTAATKAQVSEGAKRIQQLDNELAKLQLRGALDTESIRLLTDIERGTLKVTEAERLRLELLAEQIDAENELIAAEKTHQQALDEGAALVESLRTPLEVYTDATARLVELLNAGAISQETFNRAVAKSYDDYTKAGEAANKSNENLKGTDALLEELAGRVDGYGKEISSTLVDFAIGTGDAKTSFSDMVTSILSDIAKMVTQIMVVEPLIKSLKQSLTGASSGGSGGIGALLGSLFSGFTASANGNAFNGGHVMAFAKGGVVTGPTLFPMAKGSGLMGEAGPEAVMPLSRDSQGRLGVTSAGGGMTVNIYNQAGADVSTEEQQGQNGERILNVMIVRAVETAINTGRLDSTFNSTYGLNRRGR